MHRRGGRLARLAKGSGRGVWLGGNKQMGEGERSNKWESPCHHFRGNGS